MYLIILFGIISLIRYFIINWDDLNDKFYRSETLFISLIPLIAGGLIGYGSAYALSYILPIKTEIQTYKIELVNLNDKNNTEGDFFLGSGQIEGVMKYTYYYKSEDGYKLGTINAEGVLIKYTDELPHIEIHKKKLTKDSFINKFVILNNNDEISIHIPEGSIKTYYNLDAQ